MTQPGNRDPQAGRSRRSGWTEPQALCALAAVIISVVSLFVALDSARSGRDSADISRREASRAGVLDVSAVAAYLGTDLEGETVPLRPEDEPRKVAGLAGPKIDITLKNRGSGEAMLTSATVTVLSSETLSPCMSVGGTEGIAANYDFPVDVAARPPFTMSEELRFAVPSGEHERFTLTVGPMNTTGLTEMWVGVVNLTMHQPNGKDIDVGPIAVVSPGQTDAFTLRERRWIIKPPKDLPCMERNARTVRDMASLDGILPSVEFSALGSALRTYLPG
ncbi:hypothetical protein ABGB18_01695 [Nonomuraea sp. B12E4]|uniref:hypothetical protein n=1 Tax=Nonomuraea sp. B12E4 TaxID=3153564 RepID=UPI00325CEDE8